MATIESTIMIIILTIVIKITKTLVITMETRISNNTSKIIPSPTSTKPTTTSAIATT